MLNISPEIADDIPDRAVEAVRKWYAGNVVATVLHAWDQTDHSLLCVLFVVLSEGELHFVRAFGTGAGLSSVKSVVSVSVDKKIPMMTLPKMSEILSRDADEC